MTKKVNESKSVFKNNNKLDKQKICLLNNKETKQMKDQFTILENYINVFIQNNTKLITLSKDLLISNGWLFLIKVKKRKKSKTLTK